jgi:hypothetical protein
MAAFDKIATVTASTKRVGAIVSGLTPDPATNIATLAITPLMPVDADLAAALNLAFRKVWQCFAKGTPDITEGDILVIGAVSYPIRAVEKWPWPGTHDVYRLIAEEVE